MADALARASKRQKIPTTAEAKALEAAQHVLPEGFGQLTPGCWHNKTVPSDSSGDVAVEANTAWCKTQECVQVRNAVRNLRNKKLHSVATNWIQGHCCGHCLLHCCRSTKVANDTLVLSTRAQPGRAKFDDVVRCKLATRSCVLQTPEPSLWDRQLQHSAWVIMPRFSVARTKAGNDTIKVRLQCSAVQCMGTLSSRAAADGNCGVAHGSLSLTAPLPHTGSLACVTPCRPALVIAPCVWQGWTISTLSQFTFVWRAMVMLRSACLCSQR